MEYSKLEYYTSKPRLDRFLSACDNSKTKAKDLYRINLRVSQSFYPVLNLFEVFLRNTLHYRISGYFSDPNWIINQANGFMNDNSLKKSNFFLKRRVKRAKRTIKRKGGTITPGKVIAEQSFGFWTSLFDKHHYRLIGGVVIQAFENKPSKVNRSILSQQLNRVRRFRNRIYHNEPICFDGNSISFGEATQIKNNIFELLKWIDPDLTDYIGYFDSIDNKIKMIHHI